MTTSSLLQQLTLTMVLLLSSLSLNEGTGGPLPCPPASSEDTEFRFTMRFPEDCNETECEYFIGVNTNSNDKRFLDITLMGNETGWIAVGFTKTPSMFDADTVGCNMYPDGIKVIESHNPGRPIRNNILDESQDDVCPHSTEHKDGRFECRFSRVIEPSSKERLRFSLNEEFHLLMGKGPKVQDDANKGFTYHSDGKPKISESMINPVTFRDEPLACPPEANFSTQFRLTKAFPEGCNGSDCTYFLGINTNSYDENFLDILLLANSTGWVAVGFTKTPSMYDTNTMGCNKYPDNVTVIESHNPSKPQRNNLLLESQNDICPVLAKFENGRFECRFSRAIIPWSNSSTHFPLNEEYYLLMGTSPQQQNNLDAGFTFHSAGPPTISERKFNPSTDGGPINSTSTELRKALIKVHGVLMVVAWPMIAGVGVFFSAFMKPALQSGAWFQVHRAFMLTSLFLGSLSFALIFIAHKDADIPGIMNSLSPDYPVPMSHFVIGIAVMLLHFVNPIIALFRCKPNGRFRWIFNLVHGKFIGYFVLILALVNISLGIFIHDDSSFTNPSFGLHLGVSGVGVLVFLVCHLYFNIAPRFFGKSELEEEYALLPKKPSSPTSSFCLPGDDDAKGIQDSLGPGGLSRIHLLLWCILAITLIILVPAMIAECVFIAITTPASGN